MTIFGRGDCSVGISESKVLSAHRVFYLDVTPMLRSWNHTNQAFGGYWSAQFVLGVGRLDAEDWLSAGLGRHVELWGPGGIAWEGFIDKITVTEGGLQVSRGPLSDIGNRVDLVYSTVDTSTDPPTVGARRNTGVVNDTASQTRWGIVHKVLSTGGATQTTAEQMRDTWILENSLPVTDQQLNLENSTEIMILVECLGYVHWLSFYPYGSTTTGTQNASTKLDHILADNPNITPIPFDTVHLDENTVQVKAYENDNLLALNLCKGIAALGGTSNERWLFGVYKDLEVWYHAAPTSAAYQHRLGDPSQAIYTIAGGWVPPWEVLPGRWMEIPDLFVGMSPMRDYSADVAYRENPRMLFIESVTFTAPLGVSVMGGKMDTLSQFLAKLGLSGVGA